MSAKHAILVTVATMLCASNMMAQDAARDASRTERFAVLHGSAAAHALADFLKGDPTFTGTGARGRPPITDVNRSMCTLSDRTP